MLSKVKRMFNHFEEGFSALLLFTSIIVLSINIILRYFFKRGLPWADETIRYLIIWVTFIGGSICARHGGHIGIDVLRSVVPEKIKRALDIFAAVAAILFLGFAVVYGIQNVRTIMWTGQKSAALRLPMWIPYAAIPVGSFLMGIRFIQMLVEAITKGSSHVRDLRDGEAEIRDSDIEDGIVEEDYAEKHEKEDVRAKGKEGSETDK